MHAHGACQRRHCTIRAPLYERAYETEAAPGPLDAMQASPRAVGATEALAPASAEDHVHLTTRNGQVQALFRFYQEQGIERAEPEVASIVDERRHSSPAMSSVQWETMCMTLAKKYSVRPPAFPGKMVDA